MKKRFLIILIPILFLCGCQHTDNEIFPGKESPDLKISKQAESYGVWFSYLEFDDLLRGKNEQEFTDEFINVINNCKNIGINTIYVQVRSHGDACYKSDLFPLSSHLCGQTGGNVAYDALKIMTELCHYNSMQIHAWINPYRCYNQTEMDFISNEYIIKKWYNEGKNLTDIDGRYYLIPSADGVNKIICDGVSEVLKYNVDGIHFDDYFYPSTDPSIDEADYIASGYNDLQQFRLDTISNMVSSVYKTVKKYDKNIIFGISPQGNIENDYNKQYADVKRWCSESGYIDYIAPQIYYGFRNATSPFSATANRWQEIIKQPDIKLIGGLAVYKVGTVDNNAGESGINEWKEENGIISKQIADMKKLSSCNGIILYRYNSIFNPAQDRAEQIKKETESFRLMLN